MCWLPGLGPVGCCKREHIWDCLATEHVQACRYVLPHGNPEVYRRLAAALGLLIGVSGSERDRLLPWLICLPLCAP